MSETSTMSNFGDQASKLMDETDKAMDSGRASAATTLSNAAAAIDERAAYLPGGKKVEGFARNAADTVAASADYVRSHDTKAMMADVEAIVKANPGRSLAVAGVVGFLAGRAFRDR